MRTISCALVLCQLALADVESDVRAYLMEAADAVGIRPWMDRNRVSAYGWAEGSFTWNPESQDDALQLFNDDANEFLLNQLYLAVERSLPEGSKGGLGGKVALLYGSDARYVHQNGLLDDQSSKNEFDLLELFISGRIPVGRGITVKAGKCDTPIGAEVIEATPNALFSHSYSFYYGIPFTHTGLFATWSASEKVDVSYGIVLGWDCWDDPNDSVSQYVGVTVRGADPADSLTLQAIAGPEQADNDSDLRTVLDATWRHGWTDKISTVVDAIYGFEEADGEDPSWYGIAAYATRRLGDRASATLRAEWFRDDGGSRIGFDAEILALTLGVDWRPLRCCPNLRVRPEVRWDHAFGDEPFDAGTRADQVTIAIDVIFTF
jgi:hypothetical protein